MTIDTGSSFILILSLQGILKEKKNTNNVENNKKRIEKDTKVRINRDKVQDKGLDKKVEGEVKTDHSMIKKKNKWSKNKEGDNQEVRDKLRWRKKLYLNQKVIQRSNNPSWVHSL